MIATRTITSLIILTCALVFLPEDAASQDETRLNLPEPTGTQKVGTTVWHWIDPDRADEITAGANDVREIMAQAWYPAAADSTAEPAPYAPLYRHLDHVRPWSYPAAQVAELDKPLPVLVIAPGRGVARHFYTAVAEDLASHGYFVLAIDSPHSGRVTYPDGRYIPPAPRYRIPFEILTGPYEKVDEFFHEAAVSGAGDIAFALDHLSDINRKDPAHRFTKKLDLSRLGAFGHSLGGRIAGAAVAADRRFVAYASMEGVPPADVRKGGMDAAVLLMMTSSLPEMAHPNFRDVIPRRRNDVYIAILEGFGHNSVTDLPLIEPETYEYDVDPRVTLAVTREMLRSFFDEFVRQDSGAMRSMENLKPVHLEHHASPEE